ncbi:MAG: SRPBCC domain-containing protein [Flavobacteriales bacterium]|nr:SRPBCC domain-containing protein [Flavobacteriales bacterium]
MERVKLELEFLIKSSPTILFNYISTPSGLVEWFADDVNVKGKKYTFFWDGDENTAELVSKTNGKFVKFKWDDSEEGEFFEMEIQKDELTGDIALVVTDYADEDEADEISMLWESQVGDLRNALGA